MKQLNEAGQLVVVAGNNFGRSRGIGAPNKSFAPHYGSFTLVFRPSGNYYIYAHFFLKDGVDHHYWYQPQPDQQTLYDQTTLCSGYPFYDFSPLWGGKFYNPSVRPFLVSKDLEPG